MSKYDSQDGYDHCVVCGELTKEQTRVCLICQGITIIKPRKPTYYRDPFMVKRSHKRGNGWKENHKS